MAGSNPMDVEWMSINSVTPYGKNAKKHPKDQVDKIAKSIDRFGWAQPIVVDKNNDIIIGHGRLQAAKQLGLDKVPVLQMENLAEDEVKALRLADNKLNESEWDMDLVNQELDVLPIDLKTLTGFEDTEVLEPQEDDFDTTPPVEPKSKLGDIYQLGNHRLMCGDSTNIEDVEKLMDGQKADMVFTDPPYGIDYQDTKKKFEKIKNDAGDPTVLIIDALSPFNYCKSVYVCCNWRSLDWIIKAMDGCGLHPKCCIIWEKETRIQNLDKFFKQHEFIVYSGPYGGEKTVDGDVWRLLRETRDDHPTSKPVELISKAIRYSSIEEGNVVDMFGGSGSTVIACEQMKRRAFIMELEPKYIDVIINRWEKFTGLKAELLTK